MLYAHYVYSNHDNNTKDVTALNAYE